MALLQGLNKYPYAVLRAGAWTAWDQKSITGYRPANLTKTRTGNAGELAGLGWTTVTGSENRIQSTGAGKSLIGWDTEGYAVWVKHSNCIVRDCKVDLTTWGGSGFATGCVYIDAGSLSNTLIEYNELNGGTNATSSYAKILTGAAIYEQAGGTQSGTTIRNNYIHHSGADGIQASGDNHLIELNRITIGGWWNGVTGTTPHCDLIQYTKGASAGSLPGIIQDNFFDFTADASHTYGRTSCTTLNTSNGVTYRRNIVGYGALTSWGADETPGVGRTPVLYSAISTNANMNFNNNVFEFRNPSHADGPMQGTTIYGISSWTGNYYITDGSVIIQPA